MFPISRVNSTYQVPGAYQIGRTFRNGSCHDFSRQYLEDLNSSVVEPQTHTVEPGKEVP